MKKLLLLLAAGIGYVLGARAGRERYEQIRSQANRLWNDPRVQDRVDDASKTVKSTASDVGNKAASKVSETVDEHTPFSPGSGQGQASGQSRSGQPGPGTGAAGTMPSPPTPPAQAVPEPRPGDQT